MNWAIQLLEKGEIYDLREGNEYWKEISGLESEDWNDYEFHFRKLYKERIEKIEKLSEPKKLDIKTEKRIKKEMERKGSDYGIHFVIEYIKEHTLISLTEELSIVIEIDEKNENLLFIHSNLLASPKENLIVDYCANGLLLEKRGEEYRVIAYNYARFFDIETKFSSSIDFSNSIVSEKRNPFFFSYFENELI